MKTKRAHEGYLVADHRNSPGIPAPVLQAVGLPACLGQGLAEFPSYTCSHCQRIVMLNPLRTRDRAYCPKCDHLICDECEAVRVASGGDCKTYKQVVEEIQEANAKAGALII